MQCYVFYSLHFIFISSYGYLVPLILLISNRVIYKLLFLTYLLLWKPWWKRQLGLCKNSAFWYQLFTLQNEIKKCYLYTNEYLSCKRHTTVWFYFKLRISEEVFKKSRTLKVVNCTRVRILKIEPKFPGYLYIYCYKSCIDKLCVSSEIKNYLRKSLFHSDNTSATLSERTELNVVCDMGDYWNRSM